MSWTLLLPIAEKLVDLGVDYLKSDSPEAGLLAEGEVAVPSPDTVIILAVEYTGTALEENIKEALTLVEGLEIKELTINNRATH